jgi:hypothetical protein
VRFAATTVSSRERARDRGQQALDVPHEDLIAAPVDHPLWEAALRETAVLGEWRLGLSVLAADDAPAKFEVILKIIASGSFPKPADRETLALGQRRQFRDAMIFEAHVREGRDVFVSDDRAAFIGKDGEQRRQLECLFGTRIFTVDEFCDSVASLAVV